MPGLTAACRYQAIDGQAPPWLALYETASPQVLDSPEYKALVAGGSDREKFIMSHLATLDRRVYEQLSEDRAASAAARGGPAPAILSVANYRAAGDGRRHGRLVRAGAHPDAARGARVAADPQVPADRRLGRAGWSAPIACRCTSWPVPQVLEEPAYRAAVSTPWRDRIVARLAAAGTAGIRFPQRFLLNLRHA